MCCKGMVDVGDPFLGRVVGDRFRRRDAADTTVFDLLESNATVINQIASHVVF